MQTQWAMTDNDTDTLNQTGWSLMPSFVTPVIVAPPESRVLMSDYPVDIAGMGGFALIRKQRMTDIEGEIHSNLLNESIQEYGDIWRDLAVR